MYVTHRAYTTHNTTYWNIVARNWCSLNNIFDSFILFFEPQSTINVFQFAPRIILFYSILRIYEISICYCIYRSQWIYNIYGNTQQHQPPSQLFRKWEILCPGWLFLAHIIISKEYTKCVFELCCLHIGTWEIMNLIEDKSCTLPTIHIFIYMYKRVPSILVAVLFGKWSWW